MDWFDISGEPASEGSRLIQKPMRRTSSRVRGMYEGRLEVRDRLLLALKAALEKADAKADVSELTGESFADGYARELTQVGSETASD